MENPKPITTETTTPPAKRKTLDDRLGIIGLSSIAVIGSLFTGGILKPIAYVCGLSAIYYLIKRRKDPTISKNTKIIGWVLIIIWLIEVAMFSQNIPTQ